MSGSVRVQGVTLALGAFRLREIDLAVSSGEILVIIGANGSGKSVTLETIAGFHRPDSGRILIGGRDVTELPPERRNVGFVVQDFGLFPHLSVAQNVAIARRGSRITTARNTAPPPLGDDAALLRYFGAEHLAAQKPASLSPGEKQRVALARALAGAPDLFLFDEPFSALDAETRDRLREELKSFLRALDIPAIFVSHDRTDAQALADKIAVLGDGAVMQSGSAEDVWRRPASATVARFIGVENVLAARAIKCSGDDTWVEIGEQRLTATAAAPPVQARRAVSVSIRADDVVIGPPDGFGASGSNRLAGRVISSRNDGALVTLAIDCGFPLKAYVLAREARSMSLGHGSAVAVAIAPEAIHVMPD